MNNHPTLTKLIFALASDNDMTATMRPRTDWQWPADSAELEDLARNAKLTEADVNALAAGSNEDINGIISAKQLHPVDDFLNMVFDGDYTENFFTL